MKNNDLRLPNDYNENIPPVYFLDAVEDEDLIWQPQVYELAFEVINRSNIKYLIDIGSGNGKKLKKFLDKNIVVHVFDFGDNLNYIRAQYSSYNNLFLHECNLEENIPHLDDSIIQNSLIIASDVIEHIVDPKLFLRWLHDVDQKAQLIFLSTPDRDRIRGYGNIQAPQNKAHVREWSLSEFLLLLNDFGIKSFLNGFTVANNKFPSKSTFLVIFGKLANPNTVVQRKCESNIHPILNIDESMMEYCEYYIDFWSKNFDFFYILDSKSLLNKKGNDSFCIVNTREELPDLDWLIELNLSDQIESPLSGFDRMQAFFEFVDDFGFNRIEMKKVEKASEYLVATNSIIEISKNLQAITIRKTYPFYIFNYVLKYPLSDCGHLNSLDNKFDYIFDFLSISSNTYKSQTLKIEKEWLASDNANKEKYIQELQKTFIYKLFNKLGFLQ